MVQLGSIRVGLGGETERGVGDFPRTLALGGGPRTPLPVPPRKGDDVAPQSLVRVRKDQPESRIAYPYFFRSLPMFAILVALVFGYGLGSIPFGLVLTRAAGLGFSSQ